MKKEDIKPGVFCYNYKKVNKLYQIVGIARTDDIYSSDDYNREPDFVARNVEDDEQNHLGFIFPNQKIVISQSRKFPAINDRYVIYNTLAFVEYNIPRIWARKLDDFVSDAKLSEQTIERFTEV